jgi:hypothetical protein
VVRGDIRKIYDGGLVGSAVEAAFPSRPGQRHNPDFVLVVGNRRFSVNRQEYDAAPDEGEVAAYVLPTSQRLVNLERLGDSTSTRAADVRAEARGAVRRDRAPAATALSGSALRDALVGRWTNVGLGMTLEFRPDGRIRSSGPDETEERTWQTLDDGRVRLGDDVLIVSIEGDTLTLRGDSGPALRFERG